MAAKKKMGTDAGERLVPAAGRGAKPGALEARRGRGGEDRTARPPARVEHRGATQCPTRAAAHAVRED
ncbi:hypothetical protein [Burkholderia glumae]|uniref:hypothetical protein n=1 Tax=Burkholderia glumae TaxID=337 RepID=UPI001297276D|nr:hypothetical protein [Burkholderia glumae]MCM2548889.1 hypothetical protein [Burkholderia glumae]NVE23599.1 hypothetical protein [Burkholderia glumae]QGA36729.1 hypothetical protein GAS19_02920 [Burkholderia glumae]